MPGCRSFRPEDFPADVPPVQMTVDEYECIRLVDFEGMTQAECAAQMQVARTTVQMIYEAARYKSAPYAFPVAIMKFAAAWMRWMPVGAAVPIGALWMKGCGGMNL